MIEPIRCEESVWARVIERKLITGVQNPDGPDGGPEGSGWI